MNMKRKWNLQDIRPTERERQSIPTEPAPRSTGAQDMMPPRNPSARSRRSKDVIEEEVPSIDIIDGNSKRRTRLIIGVVVAALILGAGFAVNLMMSGAKITVQPKFRDVTVQANFTAYQQPQSGQLGYEMLTLEKDGEQQVTASGTKDATQNAEGTMFIYNAYSANPQQLIKNTRFASPDGLIFRIQAPVTVPGYTKDNGGKIVPGVVTAKVVADGPGAQYNIAPAHFTIPGLKGSNAAQYNGMYGETTDATTGGFEGKKYIIDNGELDKAVQTLHNQLRDELLKELTDKQPAGTIMYNNAIAFYFQTLPATSYGDQLATIKVHAKLQVPIFKANDFASYIAANTVAGYENAPVRIVDPTTLTFSYPSLASTTQDLTGLPKLDFKLSGQARLVWTYDQEKLKSDLAGLPKTSLTTVLSGYPAITKATAEVRPFWKQSFPSSPSDITLVEVLNDQKSP